MDRFDAMRTFIAVSELHSFTAAARRLGVSASVVTRGVAALEEHLGLRLLQRTTRSVALTDAGARYLARARRILADVEEAEGEVQVERSTPTGRLAVAAPSVFGRLHVAPVLSTYLALYEAVAGELFLADRLVNLVEEGIDVAVRLGALADSTLVSRAVGHTRRVLVGAPEYLEARGRPRSPETLLAHRLIQFTSLAPTPDWRFFRGEQVEHVSFRPSLATNSADAAVEHAERGQGLALVLGYQAQESIRAGRLEVLLPDYEPPPMPIQLVYPTSRLLSAKVRAFADHVTSTCTWEFVDY